MDRLDRRDLADAAFDVVLRGYDKRQVDERLRFLGSQLTAAENALRVATQRTAALQDELNEVRAATSESPGDSNFGARVEKILNLAQDEAREVRSQADAAAAAVVDQARTEAAEQRQRAEQEIATLQAEVNRRNVEQDKTLQRRSAELDSARLELDRARQEAERESERVRAQALAEADHIRKAVGHEADELFKAARADADQVCHAARAEAEQLVAQARAEAERLVAAANDTAAQRERASAHELHQLSRLHEEINADLFRAKEVLDSLFGATGTATRTNSGPPMGPMAGAHDGQPAGSVLPKRRRDGAQPAR
jgi:cell division septum initiation protein DivIVA